MEAESELKVSCEWYAPNDTYIIRNDAGQSVVMTIAELEKLRKDMDARFLELGDDAPEIDTQNITISSSSRYLLTGFVLGLWGQLGRKYEDIPLLIKGILKYED